MTSQTEPALVAAEVVDLMATGRFAELPARFAPPLLAAVSADTVRVAWLAETTRTGPVITIGTPVVTVGTPAVQPGAPAASATRGAGQGGAGLVRVRTPVTCERGGITVIVSVDAAGMLHGLRLAPPDATAGWTPPGYARPRRFTEHDITVGSGPLAVAGTLSLPRGRARRPAVVLLSGGGPFDRDATAGANKPLRDLAWGLASQGVVTARFDKPTATHPRLATDGYTMVDEYVTPAVAAVDLLRHHPAVDPARIVVLGHSLGGKAAPRVAAAAPAVAGLVLLAAEALPMHRSAVRVARHLAAGQPRPAGASTTGAAAETTKTTKTTGASTGTTEAAEAAAAAIARQAALVDGADLGPDTPAADLPFGLPARFWLDERDYDPVATAATLHVPMLLLQGGRDYQVTVADDLARWRAALGDRPEVTIRVLDADNHLFFAGTGPSTPAEYEPPQHVDPVVIMVIARWLAPPPRWRRALPWLRSRDRGTAGRLAGWAGS